MKMAVFAGAVALAMTGSLFVSEKGFGPATASAQDVVITEGKIARLKRALNLKGEQRRHWAPVEAALRSVIRARQKTPDTAGGTQSAALYQISSVAGPLIASLDENQKRNGMNVIRSMGVASLQ